MLAQNPLVRRIVRLALDEDIGTGDVTTEAVVPPGTEAVAEVVAKGEGILAGVPVAVLVLAEVDPTVRATVLVEDGATVGPGTVVLRAEGPARSLLVAERTLLDFVMRLSGVATAARRFAEGLAGSGTVLLDTRKTTPGLRVLEKYAARVGGARNHRTGLAGGVLIKNNHLAVCGDLAEAVRRARVAAPLLCKVEVEVRTPAEARQAAEAGADVLLLDHMPADEVAAVVRSHGERVGVEVSGDITPEAAKAASRAGAGFVSSGAITHRAPWIDFSMYLVRPGPARSAAG